MIISCVPGTFCHLSFLLPSSGSDHMLESFSTLVTPRLKCIHQSGQPDRMPPTCRQSPLAGLIGAAFRLHPASPFSHLFLRWQRELPYVSKGGSSGVMPRLRPLQWLPLPLRTENENLYRGLLGVRGLPRTSLTSSRTLAALQLAQPIIRPSCRFSAVCLRAAALGSLQ